MVYVGLIVLTRLSGLRSYSKMTTFDFVVTIATGSIMASALLLPDVSVPDAVLALALLFILQIIVSKLRLKSKFFANLVTNRPILLVKDGKILEENLEKSRISKRDIYAQLRLSSVNHIRNVQAVILETTSDFSIIMKDNEGEGNIDEELLEGVRK